MCVSGKWPNGGGESDVVFVVDCVVFDVVYVVNCDGCDGVSCGEVLVHCCVEAGCIGVGVVMILVV